jgi:hypothetical protein
MTAPGYKKKSGIGKVALWAAVAFVLLTLAGIFFGELPQEGATVSDAAAPIEIGQAVETEKVYQALFATDYAKAWPWPEYETGKLYCTDEKFGGVNRPLVLIELGETTYGLIGAAFGVGGVSGQPRGDGSGPMGSLFGR